MGQVAVIDAAFEQAKVSKVSHSIITRLFKELDDLRTPDTPTGDWLSGVLALLQFSKEIEVGFGHAKAYALAILHDQWEHMSPTMQKQLGFSFMTFAKETTGKETSTIDNYIRTARVWLIDKASPDKPIEIKERALDGKPILNENGVTVTKLVEFTPAAVDMSKLLLCNARAARGEMTDQLWEMLIDPFYSCTDIKSVLANGDVPHDIETPRYFLLGPGLYCEFLGETYCVAEELNWAEYEHGGPVKDAIDMLLRVLDVVFDEDAIFTIEHRGKA